MAISKERWFTLTLAEQMGHIGSEVGRARIWQDKGDEKAFWGAVTRALELFSQRRFGAPSQERLNFLV
ncbi:hypothetical protein HYT04_01050 [Candidatus Kaiserbacteria bacterium]|nr:hypothetical protein [Candidatus Kaiserbacteria bacterium]